MAQRMRKHVPLKTKLAAALLALGHIPYDESKGMTAEQIIRRYDWDHWPILHALGGTDAPWNLRPLIRAVHREKSRKDASAIAKVKRIVAKQAPRPRVKSAHAGSRQKPDWIATKRPGRPWAVKRKMPSRCWKATPPKDIWADVEGR